MISMHKVLNDFWKHYFDDLLHLQFNCIDILFYTKKLNLCSDVRKMFYN